MITTMSSALLLVTAILGICLWGVFLHIASKSALPSYSSSVVVGTHNREHAPRGGNKRPLDGTQRSASLVADRTQSGKLKHDCDPETKKGPRSCYHCFVFLTAFAHETALAVVLWSALVTCIGYRTLIDEAFSGKNALAFVAFGTLWIEGVFWAMLTSWRRGRLATNVLSWKKCEYRSVEDPLVFVRQMRATLWVLGIAGALFLLLEAVCELL